MELVIVWGIAGTESSVAYLGDRPTYNPKVWAQLTSKFGYWLKSLANLANLTDL